MARRQKKRIVWDTINLVQADLPSLILDSTQARDGAFSGIKRYEGTDLTVERTIFQTSMSIRMEDFQVNPDSMLELCVGLSWFDSQTDAAGLAINTTLAAGTGPLSDADNNKWSARCCVQIPIGSFVKYTDKENLVFPLQGPRAGPGTGYWWIIGASTGAGQEIGWFCEWDSRTRRRQHGIETPFLNIALEAEVSATPAAGDDITVLMNAFSGRQVLSLR